MVSLQRSPDLPRDREAIDFTRARARVFSSYRVVWGGGREKEVLTMLWTIAVLLLLLWAVGMVSSYTLGGLLHLLLLLAIIVVLIRVIQGRSPVV